MTVMNSRPQRSHWRGWTVPTGLIPPSSGKPGGAWRSTGHSRPQPATVVPTHGDWQPRNWLVHRGEIRAIDFGRFDFRPAATDLCRLAVQQWRGRPELEQAFLDGYGADPRSAPSWRIDLLQEAVGTAVWAFQVGDAAFEDQGHRMLREALQLF